MEAKYKYSLKILPLDISQFFVKIAVYTGPQLSLLFILRKFCARKSCHLDEKDLYNLSFPVCSSQALACALRETVQGFALFCSHS